MSHWKKSRHKLKHNYITIKNEIRNTALDYGGLFTTHDVITGGTQWVDFFFLSKKEKILWNACIDTAKLAYQDIISEIAKKEEEILTFWRREKIFEKSLTKDAPRGDFTSF